MTWLPLRLLAIISFVLVFSAIECFGQIETDRIELSSVNELFQLFVIYDGDVGGGTLFDLEGTAIRPVQRIQLGEPNNWYVVSEGDIFSEANIDSGIFPNISFNPLGGPQPEVDLGTLGDHFFAVTEKPHLSFGYGWAKVRLSEDPPQLLESAFASGVEGIVIGTQTIVPEPEAYSTAWLGIAVLVWLNRCRNRNVLQTSKKESITMLNRTKMFAALGDG